jgi:hypothetical protein
MEEKNVGRRVPLEFVGRAFTTRLNGILEPTGTRLFHELLLL